MSDDTPSVPMPKPPAKPASKRAASVTPGTSDTTGPRSQASTPPPPRPSRAVAVPREKPKPKLQQQLEELLMLPTLATSIAGDEYPTFIISTRAPAVAEAWYNLAQENRTVKKMLERLVEGSAIGAVVFSSAAMLIPVAGYYGLIPAMDPFAAMNEPYPDDGQSSGPIVPPPPMDTRPASRPSPGGGGTPPVRVPTAPRAQDTTGAMTSPVADGSPPGVVTVAGLRARGIDQSTNNGS